MNNSASLIVLQITIFIYFLITNINIANNTDTNVNIINKPNTNYNRIIKSNYNYKYNTFNILYTKGIDTVGLDDIYPYELDSLIKDLNRSK